MIVNIELFNASSRGSAVKILCECDDCGARRLVPKQNIIRPPRCTYTLCHRCHLLSREGTKHVIGEKFREGVRRGHLKRDHSTYKLVKDHPRTSGPANNRWNPDRELVAKREKARKAMYSMLRRCEKLFGTPKTASVYETLGYSPDALVAHLEAQFESGMTWEDRGAWHIDHIRPIAVLVAAGEADPRVINALQNLRPLWKAENLSRARMAA